MVLNKMRERCPTRKRPHHSAEWCALFNRQQTELTILHNVESCLSVNKLKKQTRLTTLRCDLLVPMEV